MACYHNYIFQVSISRSVFAKLVRATPPYDEASAIEAVDGWWRGKRLWHDNRMVTVHLSALLTEERMVAYFDGLQKPPRKSRPKGRDNPWVLLQVPNSVMDASTRAAKRLRRTTGKKVELRQLRHDGFRQLMRDVYCV